MKPQDRTRAILRSGLKSLEKLLAIAICDYMSAHDESWPSVPTLVADTGIARSTVLRLLGQLDGRGFSRVQTKGRPSRYTLRVGTLPRRDPSQSGTPPVPEKDPSQSGTGPGERPPPVPEKDPHPSQSGTPVVPERDPKRDQYKRPVEATNNNARAAHAESAGQQEPPKPEPKKPSPRQVETDQGIACLRTLRDEYLRSQGKKASSWGKAKGTQKRVRRFLDEARAREEELGQSPLACLEALGRWVFNAPSADFWRRLPSPLEKVLGGKANDDCDRMARAKDALAWVAGGQSAKPAARRNTPSRNTDHSPAAWDAFRGDAPPPRTIINGAPNA